LGWNNYHQNTKKKKKEKKKKEKKKNNVFSERCSVGSDEGKQET
tara:strand:- start:519 stop:650 length:132 start_codon:yes stop_codon:yes gene_type:complete